MGVMVKMLGAELGIVSGKQTEKLERTSGDRCTV